MLQHHDARPPATAGSPTAETLATALDKGKSMNASNSSANNRRKTCNSRNTWHNKGASNNMNKGKIMDANNSRANDRRNTYNSMGAGNSMDNGKGIDACYSMDINNSREASN